MYIKILMIFAIFSYLFFIAKTKSKVYNKISTKVFLLYYVGGIEMKRILSLVLVFLMVFAFSACSKDKVTSNLEGSNSSASEFVAPENYASVVLVTINPQFKLYLDAAGKVLAVEPVNDDAKSVTEKIETQKGDFETVIDNIVIAVNDGGFVKENAKVDFTVTEVKYKNVNTETLLNEARVSADKSFKKIKVTIEVTTSVDEDVVETVSTVASASNTDNTSSVTDSNATTAHTHKYSAATCTKAATCSCGAINGKALGHKYSNGTCTRCKAKDPNYKALTYTSVKTKACKWNFMFVSAKGTLYDGALILNQTVPTIGAILGDKIEPDMPEAQDAITFEGDLYYCGRGTGSVPLKSITEDGTTITVTDTANKKLVLTRIDENTLKVVSSVDEFGNLEGWAAIADIPKGLILKAK